MLYPNLIPLERVGPDRMCPVKRARLRAVASNVRDRTGCRCWVDTSALEAVYGYEKNGEPHTIWGVPLANFDASGSTADDVVRIINLGRINPKIKERWAASRRKSGEHDKAERLGRISESRTRPMEVCLDRKYSRRGMGSHFRPSAVVNGLKT